MNYFEQYLFQELTEQYAQPELSADDLEELYERFDSMSHLQEVQPYLLTMRFFGQGVSRDREAVLEEIQSRMAENELLFSGLYFELLLAEDQDNEKIQESLQKLVGQGYKRMFVREQFLQTPADREEEGAEPPNSGVVSFYDFYDELLDGPLDDEDDDWDDDWDDEDDDDEVVPEEQDAAEESVVVEQVWFECKDQTGYMFAAGDVDYLNAVIYLKPRSKEKHIVLRFQIFQDNLPFCSPYTYEYDLTPDTRYLKTVGIGNEKCTIYENGSYLWVIEIDGQTVARQSVTMMAGKLNPTGPKVRMTEILVSNDQQKRNRELGLK